MNVLEAAKAERLKLNACMEDPFASSDTPRPESNEPMKSAQKVGKQLADAHAALKKHVETYGSSGGNMGAANHLATAASHVQDAFHSLGKANTAHQFAGNFQK